jgi:putative hemolysin
VTNKDNASFREEFSARLDRLKGEGLVNFSASVNVGNHTKARDLVIVYNNVLRMREEGKLNRVMQID